MSNFLTGVKPTGMPHLGNYLGAIKPAIDATLSGNSDDTFFFFIADYHSLTTLSDPKAYKEQVYQVAATWLACGLDPEKVIFYKQSDIPEIFELSWLLSCNVPKGDLNRAHAYKAAVTDNIEKKNDKDPDHGINMGLYFYPVLMAADILLFDSNIVPVGLDQVQHVEIARSIAQRINGKYGDGTLVLPQERVKDGVKTVVGLDGRKMSKSYNNHIPLFIPEKKLKKMINKITTDSSDPDAPKDPDSSLVFDYYKIFATKEQVKGFRKELEDGLSWGHAKAQLFELINSEIKEMREKYESLISNPDLIDNYLEKGKINAQEVAKTTMKRVRKRLLE